MEKSGQAQQEIISLREELREAKLERGQKVQYDEFTRAMLKKTPKSRTEQIAYVLIKAEQYLTVKKQYNREDYKRTR